MKENIMLLLQILTTDFFIAFGLYSLLFLIISIFTKNIILYKIDTEATKFISFVGIIYFTIWIIGIFVFYFKNNAEEQNMLNRLFGQYWFGIWSQPILWLLITQLLRIKRVQKNIFLRIVFSFLLMISIERLIIFISSLHRDYLPSSWTMYGGDLDIYPSNIILALLFKIIIFLLFLGTYYIIKRKIKHIYKKNAV